MADRPKNWPGGRGRGRATSKCLTRPSSRPPRPCDERGRESRDQRGEKQAVQRRGGRRELGTNSTLSHCMVESHTGILPVIHPPSFLPPFLSSHPLSSPLRWASIRCKPEGCSIRSAGWSIWARNTACCHERKSLYALFSCICTIIFGRFLKDVQGW